jgi:uncharacterized membrane protein
MLAAHRPSLALPATPGERRAEIAGGVLISVFVIFAAVVVPRLPGRVPVHFGADGRPDAWSSPSSLLLLPAFAVALYVGLSLLQRVPHLYKYPFVITSENAARVYRAGRQIVLTIKILGTLDAAVIFYAAVSRALGGPDLLSGWFLSAVLITLATLVLIGVARRARIQAAPGPSSMQK